MKHTTTSRDSSLHSSVGRRPAGTKLATAALAAALLLAAACGTSDDEDSGGSGGGSTAAGTQSAAELLGTPAPAEGTPVRIGMISDGKGPVSDLSFESEIADDTVAYLNEYKSGIAGRPIELVECEALADPALGTDCANQMVEEEVVAVVVGSSSVGESIWEPLHQAEIPLMFANTTATGAVTDSESTFTLTDPHFAQVDLQVQQAKDAGLSKVTAVVIDVPTAMALYTDVLPDLYREQGVDLEVVPIAPGTADMTPQMQPIAAGDPTTVSIVGSDAFCISALNGLQAVGFDGPVAAVSVCVTDALRTAVPGEVLDGIVIAANAPVGTDNPATRLLGAIADTYGGDYDVNRPGTMSMFTVVAALQAAAKDVTGDITPASMITAIRSAPEQDLPGATGLRFRCNGNAVPTQPAVCVRGGLSATLDDEGRPSEFVPTGVSPIED